MTQKHSTRLRLETVALAEGWNFKGPRNPLNDTFTRGNQEVTVGYRRGPGGSFVLQWCALFIDGEPFARYGLIAKQHPGSGGGEIVLNVKNKAKIVTDWLIEGGLPL